MPNAREQSLLQSVFRPNLFVTDVQIVQSALALFELRWGAGRSEGQRPSCAIEVVTPLV